MHISSHPTRDTKNKSIIQVKIINKNASMYLLISHGNAEEVGSVYDWANNTLVDYLYVNIVIYGRYILFI